MRYKEESYKCALVGASENRDGTERERERKTKKEMRSARFSSIVADIVAIYVVVVVVVVGHKIISANSNQSTECCISVCTQCLAYIIHDITRIMMLLIFSSFNFIIHHITYTHIFC